MPLILRKDIDRKLTIEELDNNFTYLDSKGGYQLLGSLQIDINLATQSLTNPIAIGISRIQDPSLQSGDIVNRLVGPKDNRTITGTASVVSVELVSEDNANSTYRVVINDIVGIIYDHNNENEWGCLLSGSGLEVSTYYDNLGPDQEITLSGTNHIIKDIVLCKPTTDLTGSGDLQISTGELRGGISLVNTFNQYSKEKENLSLLTSTNSFINTDSGLLLTTITTFISNKLYVTVNVPLGSLSSLTCLVYGYQID
jgi:hypothetical protein